MFERLNTPEEALNYKLGAALTMEKTVLGILEESIDNAQDEEVKTLFREHHGESQEHVRTLERAFELLGWEVDESPCPAIDGLEKEGKTTVKKADDAVVDLILLQGALEVEHHEIVDVIGEGKLRSLAVAHPVHGKAVLVQALLHALPDHGVVFDQQQTHGVYLPSAGTATDQHRRRALNRA